MADLFPLPDNSFYRVSAKALLFDADDRLLVFLNDEQAWEVPGGGWERGETFEACLIRELAEEIHVRVTDVGRPLFCYQGFTSLGYPKVSIAARVTVDSFHLIPNAQEVIEASFVNRAEFLTLAFHPGETSIKDHVDTIWSNLK